MPSVDYNAIRGYDSAAGTSTIHWFGTSWANDTLGNSAGAVNLDGHCGSTLGPWNGPILIAHKGVCSVGINTGNTTPSTHNGRGLVVNGRGADTRGIIELWDPANGGKSVIQQVGGDTYIGQLAKATGNGHLYFLTGGSGTSATVSMMVTCAGLVGIGTGSPQSALHVCGPLTVSATGVGVHLGLDVGGYAGIQLSGAPAAGAYIDFSCSGADAPGRIIYYHAANSLDFTVCAASRMTIVCNGNIGVGTTDPITRLHVEQSTTGEVGRFRANVAGCADVVIVNNAQTWGFRVDNAASNAFHLRNFQNTTNIMTLATGGNVGVGITAPSYRLHVNGTFYAAGSSADYKQGVCQYNTDSCMFMKLNPVTYQYKDEYCHLGKELKSGTQIGLIAEEVAEVYPELAILVNEEDEKVVRNVDYEKLSIILLSELQKLRAEVDELKSK